MTQDDNEESKGSAADNLAQVVSRNFGALLAVSVYQTRALMELTNAISIDPNVSENTRAEAHKAARSVDQMIAEFDKLADAVGAKSGFHHE
jgi:hypothetical protein